MKLKWFFMVIFLLFVIGCKSLVNNLDNNTRRNILFKRIAVEPILEDVMIPPIMNSSEILRVDNDIDIVSSDDKKDIYRKIRKNGKKKGMDDVIVFSDDLIDQKTLMAFNNGAEDQNLDLTNIENIKIKEFDLREIDVEENQNIYISLPSPGWVIKSMKPKLIELIRRENAEKNTFFIFRTKVASVVNIIFLRYDSEKNIAIRQPYKVTVIPRSLVEIEETIEDTSFKKESLNKKANNNKVIEKEEDEDLDYKKDIANQFFNRKEYLEAKKGYISLINTGKADPEIYYKMGLIERESSNIAKANEYLYLVVKEKDSLYYIDALLTLIKNLKQQKKYTEAVDAFYKYGFSESLDKKTAQQLYILLASVYFNMKDFKSAANEYRRYTQRFPESDQVDKATFYLAYSIENLAIDPDFEEAYRLYNIIIDEYPESEYYSLSKKRILHLERHYLKIH